MHKKNNIENAGFTLIELIIVLIIIGLAASVTFISIGIAHKKAVIRDAAKRYYLSLRQARVLAATKRMETAVILSQDGKSYQIVRVLTKTNSSGEKEESYDLIQKVNLPHGIMIQGDNIYFFPLGGSSGGKVSIEDTQERTFGIRVNDITGKIKLKRIR